MVCFPVSYQARNPMARIPSVHSFVCGSKLPYNWPIKMDFGLIRKSITFTPSGSSGISSFIIVSAVCNTRQILVFAPKGYLGRK